MPNRCSFDEEENKLDHYRGRDCINKLCKNLKEHAMKIINYEKKKKKSYNWLLKKIGFMICKRYAIYVRKSLVLINMIKIIKIKKC